MIDIDLPSTFTPEFFELIPKQRAMVNQLLARKRIIGYSLSEDRKKLWVTLYSDSEKDVELIIRKMPLYAYFTYKIYELAFHNVPYASVPGFSLN